MGMGLGMSLGIIADYLIDSAGPVMVVYLDK
jgi:hypothetical protein